jgi:hypothetical protein
MIMEWFSNFIHPDVYLYKRQGLQPPQMTLLEYNPTHWRRVGSHSENQFKAVATNGYSGVSNAIVGIGVELHYQTVNNECFTDFKM